MDVASQQEITIIGTNGNELRCQSLSIENLGLNSRYKLKLEAVIDSQLDLSVFTQARIKFIVNAKPITICAMLINFTFGVDKHNSYVYNFDFGTSLFKLDNLSQTRIFVQQSLSDIINYICTRNKIIASIRLPDIKIDHITQLDVSDYDFIMQLCMQYGVIFSYDFRNDETIVCFTKQVLFGPKLCLSFNKGNGLVDYKPYISHLHTVMRTLPDELIYISSPFGESYNQYQTQTSNQTSIKGHGTIKIVGKYAVNDLIETQNYASHFQNSIDCQRTWLSLSVVGEFLLPGMRIKLSNIDEFDEDYYVIHTDFVNSVLNKSPVISRQDIIAIPISHAYAKADIDFGTWSKEYGLKPECWFQSYKKPTVAFQVGKIMGDKEVDIDEFGYYHVCPHFAEIIPNNLKNRTQKAAKLEIGAGPQGDLSQGIHFPLKINTLVMLGFINDNYAAPVIIGAMPNKLVIKDNNDALSISFKNNNELSFIDKDQYQEILLGKQGEKAHGLAFKKDKDDHSVALRSFGSMEFKSGSNIKFNTAGNLDIKADKGLIKTQKELNFATAQNLALSVPNGDINYDSANNWQAMVSEGNLLLKGKDKWYASAQKLGLIAKKAKLVNHNASMHAKAVSIYSGQNIRLTTGPTSIVINTTGVSLTTPNILLCAPLINM